MEFKNIHSSYICHVSQSVIMVQLTILERTEILKLYSTNSARDTAFIFNNRHPGRIPRLTHSTVIKINKKFSETGSVVDLKRDGRPRKTGSAAIRDEIRINIHENPHITTRELSRDLDLSRTTVMKILKKNSFHPYKAQFHHTLHANDHIARLNYCNEMIDWINEDPTVPSRIMWTDESYFTLRGRFNRQNNR